MKLVIKDEEIEYDFEFLMLYLEAGGRIKYLRNFHDFAYYTPLPQEMHKLPIEKIEKEIQKKDFPQKYINFLKRKNKKDAPFFLIKEGELYELTPIGVESPLKGYMEKVRERIERMKDSFRHTVYHIKKEFEDEKRRLMKSVPLLPFSQSLQKAVEKWQVYLFEHRQNYVFSMPFAFKYRVIKKNEYFYTLKSHSLPEIECQLEIEYSREGSFRVVRLLNKQRRALIPLFHGYSDGVICLGIMDNESLGVNIFPPDFEKFLKVFRELIETISAGNCNFQNIHSDPWYRLYNCITYYDFEKFENCKRCPDKNLECLIEKKERRGWSV